MRTQRQQARANTQTAMDHTGVQGIVTRTVLLDAEALLKPRHRLGVRVQGDRVEILRVRANRARKKYNIQVCTR